MVLSTLALQNFRNFKKKAFAFFPKVTVIVGPNTSGKTNILEAIYVLATGKSFRAELEREVIAYGEEIARIGAEVGNEIFLVRGPLASSLIANSEKFVSSSPLPESAELEVFVTTGSVGDKKAPKTQFLVNGVKKRLTDFLGNFFAVLFSPQDLQLVTDSPSLRRRYLNDVLSVVSQEYRRALLVYEKALRQRNRILERIKERQANLTQLEYWNRLLIDNGSLISEKREEFMDFVNQLELSTAEFGDFKVEYQRNEISDKRLEEKKEKEILLGMTLVGPHRDDIKFKVQSSKFKVEEKDLSLFGSRGEQRLTILWLKLGELAFIEEKTGQKPVLLLDDIFSELDRNCRDLVTQIIPNQQTIITTTDEKVAKREFLKEAKLIKLKI